MRRRITSALAVVIASLVLAGCDPYYSTRSRTALAGVGAGRIRDVLDEDRELKRTREFLGSRGKQGGGHGPVVTWWYERDGIVTCVHVTTDPDEIELAVGGTRPPRPEEIAAWEASVAHVRRRLSTDIPQFGTWIDAPYGSEMSFGELVVAALVGGGLILVLIVWDLRRRRRAAASI